MLVRKIGPPVFRFVFLAPPGSFGHMGKNKVSDTEPGPPEGPQAHRAIGHEEKAEIERRLAAVEESLTDMRRSHLEGHKWFTTVMFTLVALLLTVLGIMSKSDVREAIRDMKADLRDMTKDMQTKVDKATDEIQKQFASLSGEALKKPSLQISTARGLLDAQQLEIPWASPFPISPLFIRNNGTKRTDPLSIRLCCSADLQGLSNRSTWQPVPSNDKDYPFSYYLHWPHGVGDTIAPEETWTLQSEPLMPIYPVATNIVSCKLQVFYGADKPAESKFVMNFKR